jgi:hypothetical protein
MEPSAGKRVNGHHGLLRAEVEAVPGMEGDRDHLMNLALPVDLLLMEVDHHMVQAQVHLPDPALSVLEVAIATQILSLMQPLDLETTVEQ